MRILIFSTAYFPLIGGAEIAVKEITNRVKNCQFDLITAWFSKKNTPKEKIGNITVYRTGWGTKFDKYLLPISGFLKAQKLLKENKYSLVWSVSASYAGLAALFLKQRNPQLPFLLTLQEGSSEQRIFRRTFIIRPLFKLIFKKADYLQAISKYLADFGQKMGIKCPIKIVTNGVDRKKFEEADSRGLRKKLGIKKNERIIITVSRLVAKNGIEDLIKSLKYIDFPIKLLIVGTGPLQKKLKKLTKKLNLEDKVLFLGLILPDRVPKYLAGSDVFIRPSISEGFGNVFIEAMAAGVPIIGTPVGGIVDFLVDGRTGLFCQPGQPQTIARAAEKILKDERLKNNLIRNGQSLVEEKYDWSQISGQMNKIFKSLAKV